MKALHLVFGNVWLLLAVVVYLGGKVMRTAPSMVSFYGSGRWFFPGTYNSIAICCAALGIGFLIASYRTR